MMFFNIGDGYSSGCCSVNNYFFAGQDPKLHGQGLWEHPINRDKSFVNQIATVYKAHCITIARHRTTIEEIIDSTDVILDLIEKNSQEAFVFFGIPDLYSQIVNDEYLLLDGNDETIVAENEYIELCKNRHTQDLTNKISSIEDLLNKISKIAVKIIVYRTTSQPINLKVPDNAIYTDNNLLDYLKDHTPYKRGKYYDAIAHKTLSKEFMKLL